MRGIVWRRFLTVGAASALAAMVVGAQIVPAAARSAGTLYGVTFPATIASIDPSGGTVNPVASLGTVGPNPLIAALASDNRNQEVVALVGTCTVCPGPRGGGPVTWQLARINPSTGSVAAGVQLQRSVVSSIAVDPATHLVWAVADCSFACTVSTVVLVDPSSGSETDMATLPVSPFDTIVALAPKTHTLYVATQVGAGEYRLFAMNTSTTTVTAGPSIGQGITGMAVDPSSGSLFVLRGAAQPTVERVDPLAGTSTVLATFGGPLSYPAIDARARTLYAEETVFVGSLHETAIVAVNLRTGATATGQPINALFGPLAFLSVRRH
jgi:hypothetical protein